MSQRYNYGEEISYDFVRIKPGDKKKLQAFSCGNEVLDKYIHEEIWCVDEYGNMYIDEEDGRHFIVTDLKTKQIIGFISLATSGIIMSLSNYTHVLPSIKIDVFAIDIEYQKLHYNEESEKAEDPDEHYYFSDDVMGTVICHCRQVNDRYALVKYIVLYADKKAERFYRRNHFGDYREFMVKENNQEIRANIPMYMEIDD